MMKIRLPSITAPTEQGQLLQIKRFLYQLVEELNWTIDTISSGDSGNGITQIVSDSKSDPIDPETFSRIKALVMKSPDFTKFRRDIEDKVNTNGMGIKTQLTEGTDANQCRSFGEFSVGSNELAATLLNFPSDKKGLFRVWSGDGTGRTLGNDVSIMQEYICYDNSAAYRRAMIQKNEGGAWEYGLWKEIVSRVQADTEIM